MHVFIITQYFDPEIGAAASRWGDYVKLLIKKGYKITVLCEVPNYPHGHIFEGYSNEWFKREIISKNLTIIRSGVWANDRKSTFKILGNYLSFALIGITNALKIKKYDLIIISSPPLFIGLIAIFLKKIKKCSILLDLRDLWPESVVVLGGLKSKFLLKLGRWLEKTLYKSVDGYIFPVPGFLKYFCKSFPDELKKPMFNLMNGVDKEFLNKSFKQTKSLDDEFTVLYSGNLGLAQGLEVVLETAELLVNYPIQFRFIGDGINKQLLINSAKLKNLRNISFENSLPRFKLINEIYKASVCLVPLKNKELFREAIPTKIFEIMACGKPVILGLKGEAEQIIKKNKCGLVVEPENPQDFKNAILSYYNDKSLSKLHGENGVNYVTNYMQKDFLLSKFLLELKKQIKVLSLNINI